MILDQSPQAFSLAMSESINYAEYFEIKSLAAAVIFTILYVPLLGFYIFQAIRRRTRVYFILTLFCSSKCPTCLLSYCLLIDS